VRGLIQRVSRASVHVGQENVGEISRGLVLLLGIEKADTSVEVDKLLNKTLSYRVFPDEKNHMNLSLLDIVGELLVVSQFTLAADTKKGLRPSFSSAAQPDIARALYDEFVTLAQSRCATSTGEFGADMQVELVNDGPVTFLLTS
jgi:D-aminoacyl-tRNA deacylase